MTEIKNPKNAGRKPLENGDTSFLHIRCNPSDKSKWVKAAQINGGLSEWVKNILNKNS